MALWRDQPRLVSIRCPVVSKKMIEKKPDWRKLEGV